jgi:hypothetical protein
MKWIKCSEKMPDIDEKIVFFINTKKYCFTGIEMGFLDKSIESDELIFRSCEYRFNSEEVTHWMPVPEPPRDA